MARFSLITGSLLSCCLIVCCASSLSAAPHVFQSSHLASITEMPSLSILAATPRWWDETVQWVKGLGWDRGRLVQMWLFFMLIGLYIILRIKPRA